MTCPAPPNERASSSSVHQTQHNMRRSSLSTSRFTDRAQAGDLLAAKLSHFANHPDAVILAISAMGTIVAEVVARKLNLPLRSFITRMIPAPSQPNIWMGCVATTSHGGFRVISPEIVKGMGVSNEALEEAFAEKLSEIKADEEQMPGLIVPPEEWGSLLADKTVIVVDDGVATGAFMRYVVQTLESSRHVRHVVDDAVAGTPQSQHLSLDGTEAVTANTRPSGSHARRRSVVASADGQVPLASPRQLILAVPVASADAVYQLSRHANEIVVVHAPPFSKPVDHWFESGSTLSDGDTAILNRLKYDY